MPAYGRTPHGLGWTRPTTPGNDAAYPLRRLGITPRQPVAIRTIRRPRPTNPRTGHPYAPLDQGRTGRCTGFGCKNHLLVSSERPTTPLGHPTANQLYIKATYLDDIPGNEGDRQAGSTVRGVMDAARGFGVVGIYGWAASMDDVRQWLGGVDASGQPIGGPLLIGVNWYSSMFEVDASGYLHVSGSLAGGHCVSVAEYEVETDAYVADQSWGLWGFIDPATGQPSGRFRISGTNLERLLFTEQGEAATALELAKA